MADQNISIDVSKYLKSKAEGASGIVKLNGVVYYTERKYDPSDGTPIPMLVPITRQGVAKALEQARNDVKTFETILSDIDTAPEKLAPEKL